MQQKKNNKRSKLLSQLFREDPAAFERLLESEKRMPSRQGPPRPWASPPAAPPAKGPSKTAAGG